MAADGTRGWGPGGPYAERDIADGFDRLIAANRLFGAELDPSILKKSGKGAPFLVRKPPSRRRMLAIWLDLFGNRVAPEELLALLSVEVRGMAHGDGHFLFGRNRLLYDWSAIGTSTKRALEGDGWAPTA